MNTLIGRAKMIYRYVKSNKSLTATLMALEPKQKLVEKHVSGIGLYLIKPGSKDCSVDVLRYKESDPRHLLCLAYYSMPLTTSFLLEGCLASLIAANSNSPIPIKELHAQGERLLDVLQFEHFYDYES